ncbi:MAG: glycosyltransferase family 39 protein [Gemmatimonadetes bacterium]|nr:glycosyltransferase family 39 protein [Gemmatimonadota bacterium]
MTAYQRLLRGRPFADALGALSRALLVLGPGGLLYVIVTGGAPGVSPDSLFYVSAASTIVKEGRVATPISDRHVSVRIGSPVQAIPGPTWVARDGTPLYAFTTWPPGFPLLIAGLMRITGSPAVAAGQAVALVGGAAVLLLIVRLASLIAGPRTAVAAGALVGVLPMFQSVVRVVWSEPPFAVLVLLAVLWVSRWMEGNGQERWPLFGAVMAAVLATCVRYVGVTVYALVALCVAYVLFRHPRPLPRRSAWPVASALLLYPLLISPLVLRNIALAGGWGGVPPAPAARGLAGSALGVVLGLIQTMFPGERGMWPGPSDLLGDVGQVGGHLRYRRRPDRGGLEGDTFQAGRGRPRGR